MKKLNFKSVLFLLSVTINIFPNKDSFSLMQDNNHNLVLTMQEAVTLAIKNRSSLKAQKFATQANKFVEKQVRGGYYPQLTIEEYNYLTKGRKDIQSQITFQATQLLFDFGQLRKQYEAAQKGTEISRFQEETIKNNIQQEVEIAFLNAYLQQQKTEAIKSFEQASVEQHSKAKHEKELNLLGKDSWLKADASYASNMAIVETYPFEKKIAQQQLEYFLEMPIFSQPAPPKLKWDEKIQLKVKKLTHYLKLGLQNRPEIKMYEKTAEQAKANAKHYQKTYWPTFAAYGEITRYPYPTIMSNNMKTTSTIGLNATWNIFDGKSRLHQSNEAEAYMLKALKEKDATIKKITYEINTAYHELLKAREFLRAQIKIYRQQKNEFKLRTQEFKIGNISEVQFKEAQAKWLKNKIDWLATKINCVIQEKKLRWACNHPI